MPFEVAIACLTRALNPPMLKRDLGLRGWILDQRVHLFGDNLCRNPKLPHLVLEDVPITDCAFGETACPDILTAIFASSASLMGSKMPPLPCDSGGVVAGSVRPMRSRQKDIPEGQGCFGSIGSGPSMSA